MDIGRQKNKDAADINVGDKPISCVHENDLISRQQAIDYFVTNVGFHDEDGYPIEDTDELRKIWTEYFDGIPPAEPKRETATVSVGMSKGGVTMWYECEACGEPVDKGDTFCSGCGRRLIHE